MKHSIIYVFFFFPTNDPLFKIKWKVLSSFTKKGLFKNDITRRGGKGVPKLMTKSGNEESGCPQKKYCKLFKLFQ